MRRTRYFYLLLLLALTIPSAARATGSASVPYTIAAQSGPTLSASLLDANWTALVNYINAREVTSGTLAARPSAGTAGRWYVATDQSGGITYFDNGASWVQVGGAVNITASYAVRGLVGATSTATNTTYNVTADSVLLRNPSTGDVVFQKATASRSNSILTSGPAADGRDQAAVFTPPQWVHLYYIWNGSTLSTLSSLCAPGDINGQCSASSGPTLPSAYTHWAYIGPIRMATAGTLNSTYLRGQRAVYGTEAKILPATNIVSGVEGTVSTTNFVPPNAGSFTMFCSGNSIALLSFGARTQTYSTITYGPSAPQGVSVELPQISTLGVFYWVGDTTSSNLTCDVQSYTVPNGG